jgi:hypothetical protein
MDNTQLATGKMFKVQLPIVYCLLSIVTCDCKNGTRVVGGNWVLYRLIKKIRDENAMNVNVKIRVNA